MTSFTTQFKLLAEEILQEPALADDPKFSSNGARVKNRSELIQIITNVLERHSRDYWIEQFTGLGYVSAWFSSGLIFLR